MQSEVVHEVDGETRCKFSHAECSNPENGKSLRFQSKSASDGYLVRRRREGLLLLAVAPL